MTGEGKSHYDNGVLTRGFSLVFFILIFPIFDFPITSARLTFVVKRELHLVVAEW